MADSAQLDERNRLARLLQQQRRRESRDAAAEHGDVDRQVTRKRGKANVRLRGEPVRTRHPLHRLLLVRVVASD